MSYTPRNVLVTGGAGFIGANYVRWLLDEDAEVRIVNLD
ncbi:MAG: NAD-dependent epimerase/dehydratase family protein, partial [Nitrospira sp.]|nr:NAD-dependent epimerase/dehydratase family protein [Nitrospira sp.]